MPTTDGGKRPNDWRRQGAVTMQDEVQFSKGNTNTYITIAMVGMMVALCLNFYNMNRINELSAVIIHQM